jgi:hypothetical protein
MPFILGGPTGDLPDPALQPLLRPYRLGALADRRSQRRRRGPWKNSTGEGNGASRFGSHDLWYSKQYTLPASISGESARSAHPTLIPWSYYYEEHLSLVKGAFHVIEATCDPRRS